MKMDEMQIRLIRASVRAMRGCDPLKELAPQQVFDVCHALRIEVDAMEQEGTGDLVLRQVLSDCKCPGCAAKLEEAERKAAGGNA